MSKPEKKKCENKGACHKAFQKKAGKTCQPPANENCCPAKPEDKKPSGGCCPTKGNGGGCC